MTEYNLDRFLYTYKFIYLSKPQNTDVDWKREKKNIMREYKSLKEKGLNEVKKGGGYKDLTQFSVQI